MNLHIIHGRLVRDPELTRGADETKDRVNFTVAVDREYGDETDFIDCVVFGKRAGVIDKYFNKGKEIIVKGQGQIRSYEDKNGVKRKAYSIVVGGFDFCGSAKGSSSSNGDSWEQADADCPF